MTYNPVKARARLLARYGLKPEDFARLAVMCNGGCWICGRKPSGRRMLDIDHCHITGEVRGLLCHRCNRGLGYFGSKVDGLNIWSYLDHRSGEYTGYFVPKKKRRKRSA